MSTAKDQVTRLLALVPYLQQAGAVPLSRAAADFGVSPEQLRADLGVLWMCGLPGFGPGELIDLDYEAFENDPDGLVRIANADYLTRPLRLDSTEASALIVALRVLRDGGAAASADVVDRALAKLEAAVGDVAAAPLAAPLSAAAGKDAPAQRGPGDLGELRARIEEAVAADRQLRIAYYVPARDETTERVVDPLAVLEQEGNAYLDAWCHLAGGRRLFRLDRIDAARTLGAARTHPDEPPRQLGEALFQAAPEDEMVRLLLTPTARWVASYYPVEEVLERPDGALEVALRVADRRWLVRLVLGLAPEASVLDPPEYADEVAEQARAALALYESGVA